MSRITTTSNSRRNSRPSSQLLVTPRQKQEQKQEQELEQEQQKSGSSRKSFTVIVILLLVSTGMISNYYYIKSSSSSSLTSKSSSLTTTTLKKKSNTIFGHLHFPKTGGTNVNGRMAATYDNVCGNKGYSYDAYLFNIRGIKNNITEAGYNIDSMSIPGNDKSNNDNAHFDRGRPQVNIMNEIGYEDCDYISHEVAWTFWPNLMKDLNNKNNLQNTNNNQNNNNTSSSNNNTSSSNNNVNNNNNNITLELHVPCREPIQHLMSMASHLHRKYICDENETDITIEKAINIVYFPRSIGDMRFSNDLFTNSANNNIELKCFNPFPLENYINYMSDKLQHRRFTIPTYVRRDTNAKRSKSSECIWDSTSEEYKQKVIQLLVNKHPYMKFCYDCIGSNNELQLL